MKHLETYKMNSEGKMELVSKIQLDTPTQEELIAEKEAQLLAMYEELQALKNQQ